MGTEYAEAPLSVAAGTVNSHQTHLAFAEYLAAAPDWDASDDDFG